MINILKILLITFVTVLEVKKVECNFKFLLLHTNDLHSRYAEINEDTMRCQLPSDKCFGGFARVKTAITEFTEKAKKKGMPTVYLDVGDVFEGTVFHKEYKWQLAVKMMKFLKPQAMTLGDDEFEEGVSDLVSFVTEVGIPVVCCNLDSSEEPSVQVKPSIVITVGEGTNTAKIGVLGYITEDITTPGKLKIRNVIESVKNEVERLKKTQKVDIIIALGHAKFHQNIEVAKEVGDIDIIVGGHTHAFLYKGWFPQDKVLGPYPTFVTPKYDIKKRIPIIEAFHGTKYLGYLELEFDQNWRLKNYKGNPVLLNKKFKQDPEVLDALKVEAANIAKKYQYKIGYTEVTLNGKNGNCKVRECNIGNMIADAFVDYAINNVPKAKEYPLVGLMPGGAIRGSLHAKTQRGYTGDITLEDLLVVLRASENYLNVTVVEGRDLRSMLKDAVKDFKQNDNYGELVKADLIQVSGLKLKYDLTKGELLTSAKVGPGYVDLDDNTKYCVVTVKSLTDQYQFLQDTPVHIEKLNDYQVVEEFIKKNQVIKKNGPYSKPKGRISIHLYSWIRTMFIRLRYFLAKLNPMPALG